MMETPSERIARLQGVYDRLSYSSVDGHAFHGTPDCPACDEGQLWLWEIGMAVAHASGEPPEVPTHRYLATAMVCRSRSGGAGCGFHLAVQPTATVQIPASETRRW